MGYKVKMFLRSQMYIFYKLLSRVSSCFLKVLLLMKLLLFNVLNSNYYYKFNVVLMFMLKKHGSNETTLIIAIINNKNCVKTICSFYWFKIRYSHKYSVFC